MELKALNLAMHMTKSEVVLPSSAHIPQLVRQQETRRDEATATFQLLTECHHHGRMKSGSCADTLRFTRLQRRGLVKRVETAWEPTKAGVSLVRSLAGKVNG